MAIAYGGPPTYALVATAYRDLEFCLVSLLAWRRPSAAFAQCGFRLGAGLGVGCILPCWPVAAVMSAAVASRMAWLPLTVTGYDGVCLLPCVDTR